MSDGYNSGNAATFNQLIQTGLNPDDAATQSGVSQAASSYGFGPNSNSGSIIPGAGGTAGVAGLTQVSYFQPASGDPAQQPAQAATPAAASGYVTGVNNPSVQPTTTPAPTTDPRVIVSTLPPPTITAPAQAQAVDEFTGIDAQVEANTAAAQPFPYGDDATGVDAQIEANTAASQESPYADTAALANNQVESNSALPVEQSDAETARLARLNLEATPNESAAETNRLVEKNVQAAVGTQLAQRQAVLDAQRKMVNNGDWRVRLSLAQGANYLYNASSPGILAPLAKTGGVIFPYTPKIETVYKADYESYALTHSNYKGYFYKSSYNDAVGLTGTFTAQDTTEANYLLAVIHFFRSVTKMFYGQDAQRGAPPPLVYLTGLGQYQFSAHPCVVTSFTYNLPNDVDYIRAGSINVNGTDLTTRRVRQDLPTDPISGAIKRLENLFSSQGINKGAITTPPAPPTLGKNNPTYVPTKIEISLSLLPMQSRAQVSQVFNLKSFANGDLIKGGFW